MCARERSRARQSPRRVVGGYVPTSAEQCSVPGHIPVPYGRVPQRLALPFRPLFGSSQRGSDEVGTLDSHFVRLRGAALRWVLPGLFFGAQVVDLAPVNADRWRRLDAETHLAVVEG